MTARDAGPARPDAVAPGPRTPRPWDRLRDDRGQTAFLVVFGVAALMVMGTTLILFLGRGMTTETQTRTAADAAALAAAESVTEVVDTRLAAMPNDNGLAVGHLLQLLRAPVNVLGVNAESEARRIANANGADLVGLTSRATSSGIEYTATTRARENTAEGPRRATYEATARVRITSGALCTRQGGLGLFLGGNCVGPALIHLEAPPEEEPEPPEDGEEPPEPDYPDVPWIIVGDAAENLLGTVRGALTWEVVLTQ